MARGRYLSLEEARNMGKIDQFAKEHPLVGTKRIFDDLLDAVQRKLEDKRRHPTAQAAKSAPNHPTCSPASVRTL